jgi:phosphoglycolate phosphatase
MNKPDIKAIIFDFDNTLIDAWSSLYKSYEKTFNYFNLATPSNEYITSKLACSMQESFPKIFGNNYQEAAKIFYSEYQKNSLEIISLPYAEDLLNMLDRNNVTMSILSNKKGDLLRDEINKLGWSKYFKIIIGSDDLQYCKPSTMPVKYIAKYCDFDISDDVWFVGDTEVDIKCANNSGCYSVLYNNSEKLYTGLEKPRLIISSHLELLEILKV